MKLDAGWLVEPDMDLSSEQMADLGELIVSRLVPVDVALRARMVLWSDEGRRRKDIAELARVVPVTVDRCKALCRAWNGRPGGETPWRTTRSGAAIDTGNG
ncbi:hypothetical protein ACFYQ5_18970 [Streptomyces sp. NPDC005794]|uniref:hypothetical protein n=1 Tax=Streptomyces sp. NPDC005794 TaxID=3364733 RepID=UPI0036B6ED1B